MAHAADVFVSYSSQDKHRVFPVIERLRLCGVTVWVDQGGIDGAVLWSEEIVEAIESCKVLMLMVSSSSISSHNVVKEVALSSERKKHILPVYLERVDLPKALQYPLAGIQHVEHVEDTEGSFQSVLRSLTRMGVSLATTEAPSAGGPLPKAATPASVHEGPMLLAVLPFDNISPEKDTDYFSDGLTDELITNLSKLSEIKVVSRTTTMLYKGTKKNTKTIASELGVQYILEGSVRKIGDNLRISAQLVEVVTDAHIWAEAYKGTMADVFDIQEQVAKEIADALKLKLTPTEKAVLTKRPTIVPEAYDCGLRAKKFLHVSSLSNMIYAAQLFERAIELDPKYAEAYAGLARAYAQHYQLYDRNETFLEKALDNSLKALMYDPGLSDAYSALAYIYLARNSTEEAVRAAEKAVELDPDSHSSHSTLGRILYTIGRVEEAAQAYTRAVEIDPDAYITYNVLEMCYESLGQMDKAREVTEKIISILPSYLRAHPDDARAHMTLAVDLAKVGKLDEARQQSYKALEIAPNDSTMLYFAACLYARLGDIDLAVNTLASSVHTGWKDFEWTMRDPDLTAIRNHPGYIELMKGR